VFDALSPGGVRVHALTDFRQTQVVRHAGCNEADQLASRATHCRRSQDLVRALDNVHLDKAFLTLADGAITPGERLCERIELDALLFKLPGIGANVGDFWLRVGRPRQLKLLPADAAEEQRVANH